MDRWTISRQERATFARTAGYPDIAEKWEAMTDEEYLGKVEQQLHYEDEYRRQKNRGR